MTTIGIIGSEGKIGKKRYEICKKNDNIDNIELYDIKLERDYIDLINDNNSNIDAVFICVPHTLVAEVTINCIKKGLHIFCEKPPAISLEEMLKINSEYKKNKVLMYGFNHRYLKHIQKAKEIIDSNILGDILYIRGIYGKTYLENWRADKKYGGKGILLSQGIHMIDLFRYLSGKEFNVNGGFIGHHNKQWYEDNVMCILESEDKKIGVSYQSSCILKKNTFNMNIGFENGYIEIDGLSCSSTKSFGFPDKITIGYSDNEEFYGNPKTETFYYGEESGKNSWNIEVNNFIDTILNNKVDYECNINDAVSVMKIIEEIYGKEII